MMAASLNGALAQQKGIGTAQAIGMVLDSATDLGLDQGAPATVRSLKSDPMATEFASVPASPWRQSWNPAICLF